MRVSEVIVEQYSPYPSRWDQLPSGGDAPQHPISHSDRHKREHLDLTMINESNCEYTMPQEYVQQMHI